MGFLRVDRLTGPPAPLVRGDGVVLARRCHRATSPLARAVGLLATSDLAEDEGLWLESCACVHTMALRVPIGCAFLDAVGRVVRVVDPLPAWRVASARRARSVVECRAGVLRALRPGDVLIRL